MGAAHPLNYVVLVPFQSTAMELSVLLQVIMYTIRDEVNVRWLDQINRY
jgi:hypothetical protein